MTREMPGIKQQVRKSCGRGTEVTSLPQTRAVWGGSARRHSPHARGVWHTRLLWQGNCFGFSVSCLFHCHFWQMSMFVNVNVHFVKMYLLQAFINTSHGLWRAPPRPPPSPLRRGLWSANGRRAGRGRPSVTTPAATRRSALPAAPQSLLGTEVLRYASSMADTGRMTTHPMEPCGSARAPGRRLRPPVARRLVQVAIAARWGEGRGCCGAGAACLGRAGGCVGRGGIKGRGGSPRGSLGAGVGCRVGGRWAHGAGGLARRYLGAWCGGVALCARLWVGQGPCLQGGCSGGDVAAVCGLPAACKLLVARAEVLNGGGCPVPFCNGHSFFFFVKLSLSDKAPNAALATVS